MHPSALPDRQTLRLLYQKTLLVRRVEEKIALLYPEKEMRCPTHLSIGQEAVASGVCTALRREDYIFSTHRCHSHYLAKGGNLKRMFAELYGRSTGCAKGKGGSMHLVDAEQGMMGASALVGGTIPLAVGAALASRMEKSDRVSVAFFGDAATEQGSFHESLNFAALKKLPILFVCENNFLATHTPLSERQAQDNIWERGAIYGVPGFRLDGTNAIEVYEAATRTVSRARQGEGPSLLECRAYRWKEHVGPNEDFNKGYRSKEELEAWKARCPILQLENLFREKSLFTESALKEIGLEIDKEIEEAVRYAKESPFPDPSELLTEIY